MCMWTLYTICLPEDSHVFQNETVLNIHMENVDLGDEDYLSFVLFQNETVLNIHMEKADLGDEDYLFIYDEQRSLLAKYDRNRKPGDHQTKGFATVHLETDRVTSQNNGFKLSWCALCFQ